MLTKNQIIDLYFMGYNVKDIINRCLDEEKAVPVTQKLQKQQIRETVETVLCGVWSNQKS